MEGNADFTAEPVRVRTFRELAFAERFGLPIDPTSEVRAKDSGEAIAIGSMGFRVDAESAERLEAEAEPFEARIEQAREALRAGDRAVTEYLLGKEISDEDWEELLEREAERNHPKKIDLDNPPEDLGLSLN